jgi:hypothetical protein
MASAIQPLSSIAPAELIEYLGREGNPAEIVQWKYFDTRFNRNRERGYVWVKDGKVGGFIGLVPFQVAIAGRVAEAAWTCDWSVQDAAAKGTGILLIRQAQQNYEFLTQLGGNEATQRIVPRLAAITVNDAGIMFYLPLRVGALLRVAQHRLGRLPLDSLDAVNRVPLRLPRKPASSNSWIVEPGVSPVLGEVLEPERHGDVYSRYDLAYLRWQIADCPVLSSESCYIRGQSTPPAAALVWHQKESGDFWRMALWLRADARKEAEALLSRVIRHVYDRNGFLLSIVVSRLETELIDLLRSRGFRAAPNRRPLHIISRNKAEPVAELWPLSFVDTDAAYRFYY